MSKNAHCRRTERVRPPPSVRPVLQRTGHDSGGRSDGRPHLRVDSPATVRNGGGNEVANDALLFGSEQTRIVASFSMCTCF